MVNSQASPTNFFLMITALFDTNIYDRLATDVPAQKRISDLIECEALCVVMSRTVREEIFRSPFGGIPNFFPLRHEGNTVARCGIARIGDRLGNGDVYDGHLGESTKNNDAFIADAAACFADWLVSEDKRMVSRFDPRGWKCCAMTYTQFLEQLARMPPINQGGDL